MAVNFVSVSVSTFVSDGSLDGALIVTWLVPLVPLTVTSPAKLPMSIVMLFVPPQSSMNTSAAMFAMTIVLTLPRGPAWIVVSSRAVEAVSGSLKIFSPEPPTRVRCRSRNS